MKNLLKIGISGLLFALVSFAALTAKAYSPGKDHAKYGYKVGSVSVASSVNEFQMVGDLPRGLVVPEKEIQPLPRAVNDPKPDNTNFQLVRKESLDLHKAIKDC